MEVFGVTNGTTLQLQKCTIFLNRIKMSLISLDVHGFQSLWYPPTITTLSLTC